MENKEGFILYKSFYEPIKVLSLEEKGQLLDLIFQYQINPQKITEITAVTSVIMAFNFIKNQFKLDDKKHANFIALQREKGKKSAEIRWGNQPKITEITAVNRNNRGQPSVTEITYKDKDIHKDTTPIVPRGDGGEKEITTQVVGYYTKVTGKPCRCTESRIRKVGFLVKKDYCLEDFKKAVDNFWASDWHSGRSGQWTNGNLDWIVDTETNFVKMLEHKPKINSLNGGFSPEFSKYPILYADPKNDPKNKKNL